MNKTIDQQAQEYAEKKIESEYGISRDDFIAAGCRFGYNDVVQAYSDGYTACEQSMWRSVEEELPEEDREYLICTTDRALDTAFYEDGEWLVYGYTVAYWRELPSLPDTNTEKI